MGRNFTRTLVGLVSAVVLSLGWSDSARAVPIFYDITLTATFGPASGSGSFSIDGDMFTGSGVEEFSPQGSGFPGATGLLSFDVEIGGFTFDIDDDIRAPSGPIVRFTDGVLSLMDFIVSACAFGQVVPCLNLDLPDYIFFPFDGGPISDGVTLVTLRTTAVPEPSTLWLISPALALALLLALRPRSASGRSGRRLLALARGSPPFTQPSHRLT